MTTKRIAMAGAFAAAIAMGACSDDTAVDCSQYQTEGGHSAVDGEVPEECLTPEIVFGQMIEKQVGGDIRIAVVHYMEGAEPSAFPLALEAMLWKGQTTKQPFFGNALGKFGTGDVTECEDFRDLGAWDADFSDNAQTIFDERTYTDLGDSITVDGSTISYTLNKTIDGIDNNILKRHDIIYQVDPEFPTKALPVSQNYKFNTGATFSVPGTEHIGADPWGNWIDETKVYVPSRMDETAFTSPDLTNVGVTPLALSEEEDMVFTFDAPTDQQNNPTFAFVAVGYEDTLAYNCVAPAANDAGQPNSITLPKEIIQQMRLTDNGLYVGQLSHRMVLDENGNRVDMVGVNCIYFNYSK